MIPIAVQESLSQASTFSRRRASFGPTFTSRICDNAWDRFIEKWAGICYGFVGEALGHYGKEPLGTILTIPDGAHTAGANASFEPGSGQIRLSPSVVEGKAGITLEKLTHELTHASLHDFPDNDDVFYTEGFVDYSVWVMAHAPIWGAYRREMIDAAAFNIACRRDRALKDLSDYDRKRWAGGLFCATMHGPWIIAKLKMRKLEGNLQW
jgi:hypothetical protein